MKRQNIVSGIAIGVLVLIMVSTIMPAAALDIREKGLNMAKNGASGWVVKQYMESQGYVCFDKPWWIPVPKAYWYASTCAMAAK